MTNTDPEFVTLREAATIVGMKYNAIIRMIPMKPTPPAEAPADPNTTNPLRKLTGE
jgi:hypothetical protein